MLNFEAVVENLARTFYELEGSKWAEASPEEQMASMIEVVEKAAEHPRLLEIILEACNAEST